MKKKLKKAGEKNVYNCQAPARNWAGDSYTWRPPTQRTQCIKAEITKEMPFFHRKTLISRELRKIAPFGFHLWKLKKKGSHSGLFWATPRTPRRGEGRESSIRGNSKNVDLAKPVLPPCSKSAHFWSNLAWLLSWPLYIKLLTNALISVLNAEVSAPGVKEIWLSANFWIFFYLSPHQPPHNWRDGPKIIQGRVYETTRAEKLTSFEPHHPKMLLRYLTLAVLELFDPITPHIQTIFSIWRRVATSTVCASCKTPVAPSIRSFWIFDTWVNKPLWPGLFPPDYVLG